MRPPRLSPASDRNWANSPVVVANVQELGRGDVAVDTPDQLGKASGILIYLESKYRSRGITFGFCRLCARLTRSARFCVGFARSRDQARRRDRVFPRFTMTSVPALVAVAAVWQRLRLRRTESQPEQHKPASKWMSCLLSLVPFRRFSDLTHRQISPSVFCRLYVLVGVPPRPLFPLLEDLTVIAYSTPSNNGNDSYYGLGLPLTDLQDANSTGCKYDSREMVQCGKESRQNS